ncbi:hypothetical protein [Aureimonas altamirensis]|uniref:hypothetical protein n=1 Tax=Aureimonas altamirensis TaxID=370622 RepID=UPI003019FFBF
MIASEMAQAIVAMEPNLRKWTRSALHAFGLFTAANRAVTRYGDSASEVVELAAMYRGDTALMVVLRVHSLLDRQGEVSFQVVHRYLKEPGVPDALAAIYCTPTDGGLRAPASECHLAIAAFREAYAQIPFEVFGSLQDFRNREVAHIGLKPSSRSITYNQLEQFVTIVAELSGHVSMMSRGLNDDLLEFGSGIADASECTWLNAIQRELQEDMDQQL